MALLACLQACLSVETLAEFKQHFSSIYQAAQVRQLPARIRSRAANPCSSPWSHQPLLLQVIAVDEAQFFPDLLDFCVQAADRDAKVVLVAGLDGDFLRRQFGQVNGQVLSGHSRLRGSRTQTAAWAELSQ